MKRIHFIKNASIAVADSSMSHYAAASGSIRGPIAKKILITGGGYDAGTLKYLIQRTGKKNSNVPFADVSKGHCRCYLRV